MKRSGTVVVIVIPSASVSRFLECRNAVLPWSALLRSEKPGGRIQISASVSSVFQVVPPDSGCAGGFAAEA
ncbi:MAG: hypothetical protein R6U13_16430, partial [Desulfatiglandaceae bacterium]